MDKVKHVKRALERTEHSCRGFVAVVLLFAVLASDIVGFYSSFFCNFPTCRDYNIYRVYPPSVDCNYNVDIKYFYNVSGCSPHNITLNCFQDIYHEDACNPNDVGSIQSIRNMTVYNCSGSLIYDDIFVDYTLVAQETGAEAYCKRAKWMYLATLLWDIIVNIRNINTAYVVKHKVVSTLMIAPSIIIAIVAIVLSAVFGDDLRDKYSMIGSKIASLVIMCVFYIIEMRRKPDAEDDQQALKEIQI